MEALAIKFTAKPGSRIPQGAAQQIGRELQRLTESNAGTLTATDVVEAAAPAHSPLHPFFEWDDLRAAHLWREHQARNLVNSIIRVVPDRRGQPQEVRAFHVVQMRAVDEGDDQRSRLPRAYVTLDRLQRDARLAAQVIEGACRELQGWAHRYQQYRLVLPEFEEQFGPVFTFVEAQSASASAHWPGEESPAGLAISDLCEAAPSEA